MITLDTFVREGSAAGAALVAGDSGRASAAAGLDGRTRAAEAEAAAASSCGVTTNEGSPSKRCTCSRTIRSISWRLYSSVTPSVSLMASSSFPICSRRFALPASTASSFTSTASIFDTTLPMLRSIRSTRCASALNSSAVTCGSAWLAAAVAPLAAGWAHLLRVDLPGVNFFPDKQWRAHGIALQIGLWVRVDANLGVNYRKLLKALSRIEGDDDSRPRHLLARESDPALAARVRPSFGARVNPALARESDDPLRVDPLWLTRCPSSFGGHGPLLALVQNPVAVLVVFGKQGLDFSVRVAATLKLEERRTDSSTACASPAANSPRLELRSRHSSKSSCLSSFMSAVFRALWMSKIFSCFRKNSGHEDAVGALPQLWWKVEVAKNDAEQRENGVVELAEVLDLRAEDEPSWANGKEHDEEHDGKAHEVLGAGAEGGAQLCHGLVEADVLEELHPGQEEGEGDGIVELLLPVGEEVEVREAALVLQQLLQLLSNGDGSVDIEASTDQGHKNHYDVQPVPEGLEIVQLVALDLDDLLHDVVADEEHEDSLANQHEVVLGLDVAQQLHGAEVGRWDRTASGRQLQHQLDHAEEVDVGVVYGEVNEHDAGAAIDPQSGEELVELRGGVFLVAAQVNIVAAAGVAGDLARRKLRPSQLLLAVVANPKLANPWHAEQLVVVVDEVLFLGSEKLSLLYQDSQYRPSIKGPLAN
uniref:Reverse transcriptase domain-containing protein n=1 Tax=Macrostomum lignano TaxID=282301 RepID=A0A1I8FNI5_9PLAT